MDLLAAPASRLPPDLVEVRHGQLAVKPRLRPLASHAVRL